MGDGGGAVEFRADELVLYAHVVLGRDGGSGRDGGVEEETSGDGEPLARGHLEPAPLEVETGVAQEVGDGLPGGQALRVAGEEGLVLGLGEADVDGRGGEHDVRVEGAADGAQALDAHDLEAEHGEAELEDRGRGGVPGALGALLRLERGRLAGRVRAGRRPEAEDERGLGGDEGRGAVCAAFGLEPGELEGMRRGRHEYVSVGAEWRVGGGVYWLLLPGGLVRM